MLERKTAGNDYEEWLRLRDDLPADWRLQPDERSKFYNLLREEWSHLHTRKTGWIGVALQPETRQGGGLMGNCPDCGGHLFIVFGRLQCECGWEEAH